MANPKSIPHTPTRDSSLILGLAVTFLASIGTGAITNGIYFLTESALGYGRLPNYALALAIGLCYIVGAAGVGPGLRFLPKTGISTRAIAITLLILLGAFCLLPIASAGGLKQTPSEWSIWITGCTFGILTGCFWPIVEAYISGGRRDARLRSAIGQFNIVWASAVIFSMWLIAPYVARAPLTVFLWVGVLHLLAAGLMLPMPRTPPRHLDDAPHEVSLTSRSLLKVSRTLLPASYLLIATLSPAIPIVLGSLGVELTWKGPVFSVWLIARLFAFVLLERWHGWHGKLWPPMLGGLTLVLAFSAAMLAPRFGAAGIAVLVLALTSIGLATGVIYVAALYYGMEVGGARVDDGGHHEAIIGLGYAGGPAAGLLSFLIISSDAGIQDMAVVFIVGLISISSLLMAWRKSRTPNKSKRSFADSFRR